MKTLFTFCFILFLSANLAAQIFDKSKSKEHRPDLMQKKSLMNTQKIQQSTDTHLPKIPDNYTNSSSYLQQPEKLPLGEYIYEGVPIGLSDSIIAFVYASYDGIMFTSSADSGKTWDDPVTIESGYLYYEHLTGLKTNTGRIILIWFSYDYISYSYELKMAYSDNLDTWYISTLNNYGEYFFSLNLSCTNDNKLWLCYSRYGSIGLDLYYITSTNNGTDWSSENIFLSDPSDEEELIIVSGLSSALLAFYSDYSTGNSAIYEKYSADGGITWSPGVPVINSSFSEYSPKVVMQADNMLWLFYYLENPANLLSGFYQYDIEYIVSSDGGITWGIPQRFTHYSGNDYNVNTTLLFGKPFVSFSSSRWSSESYSSQIWYGLIGKTEDNNPPPALLYFTFNQIASELSLIINAYVDDESGISDVKGEVFVNYASQGFVQLYDDGLHNDIEANDNIWGTIIGPFNTGDVIWVHNSISDISNNTVNVNGGQYTINPLHDAGDLILSLHSNSQLAEMGSYYGTSAYWHGYDYLFLGGLWIGTDIFGEKRVMNLDYYEQDWVNTAGSIMTEMPGISDQDCSIFYDDVNAMTPLIGLSVHQKSYQWSMPGHDDFIIFEYVIKNRTYNNLNDLYASSWLDPDICSQLIASDDLGAYDPEREMIYMFDPQNNPTGYLGLRLLTETPSTAYLYTPYESEPTTDGERFQFMTAGIMPDPTILSDYRMLLTSQPFSLAPGDSQIIAFGLVMGNGLEELQSNADTMKALYHHYIVGVDDNNHNPLPTEFKLFQNYPNPFNPATKIRWQLPVSSWQTLKIYDVLGNEIVKLVDEYKPAGSYEIEFNASSLPSGVYFYKIHAGSFVQTKKMILLK